MNSLPRASPVINLLEIISEFILKLLALLLPQTEARIISWGQVGQEAEVC